MSYVVNHASDVELVFPNQLFTLFQQLWLTTALGFREVISARGKATGHITRNYAVCATKLICNYQSKGYGENAMHYVPVMLYWSNMILPISVVGTKNATCIQNTRQKIDQVVA